MRPPILFTIGHSNHRAETFFALLKKHAITAVADVRSVPFSRFTPPFNRKSLEATLPQHGLHYVFLGTELGARRTERACYVDGQARYDRIAALPLFHAGLERLRHGAAAHTIALICRERDPLECHRTILVCRHLRQEFIINHIHHDGSLESHAEAENRLLKLAGVGNTELFDGPEDLIARAYDVQGDKIAFREDRSDDARGADDRHTRGSKTPRRPAGE
jgi:uncharacterized protein (DUF488 family)